MSQCRNMASHSQQGEDRAIPRALTSGTRRQGHLEAEGRLRNRLLGLLPPRRTRKAPCPELQPETDIPGQPGWGLFHGGEETVFQKDLSVLHLMSSWNIKLDTKHLCDQIPLVSPAGILKLTSESGRRRLLTRLYSGPILQETAS